MSLRDRREALKDDAAEDARIKYDGINIDDACPGERVQLETRRSLSEKREKEKGRKVRGAR